MVINNLNCTYLAEIDFLKSKLNIMLSQIKVMQNDLIEAKDNDIISEKLLFKSKELDIKSEILINRIKTKILEIAN
ncbi:MAG: hypothetical protein PHF86_01570 [Candidatus Nanoarchaeia archaeon]|nr:hypothetical protein [Candidatus Nanoarchaeia archaeon]